MKTIHYALTHAAYAALYLILLAATYACCPKATFEGCYLTKWKTIPDTSRFHSVDVPMYIHVNGGSATGKWGIEGNSGELHGGLQQGGYLLRGEWTTGPYAGKIWFHLSPDGKSFTGTWNGTTTAGTVVSPLEWNGRRVDCDTLPVFDYLRK